MADDAPLMQWDSAAGRRILRSIAAGKRSLASVVRANALPAWQAQLIARSMRWRKRHPRRRDLAAPLQWSRSLAWELDHLRQVAVRRQLAVERFDRKGFRGNEDHLRLLLESIGDMSGQSAWNRWRRREPRVRPDLRGARLTDMDLRGLDLTEIRLQGGDLSGSIMRLCSLYGADLRGVRMRHTDLSHATLSFAKLSDAVMQEAMLVHAELGGADLRRAELIGCLLNNASLGGVKLRDAVVWGIGIWDAYTDVEGEDFFVPVGGYFDPIDYDVRQARAKGNSLKVDDIELAHFIALVSDNDKIGSLLRAAANRLVLLLGRFVGDQADVLEALRRELPRYGYAPIVFDFERDPGRDLVETVTTLAGLSRFVIADLTAPRSTPLESHAIIPDIAIPFVPLVRGEEPFAMFASLQRKYFWVVPPFKYRSTRHLLGSLKTEVIAPAERMLARLRALKNPNVS